MKFIKSVVLAAIVGILPVSALAGGLIPADPPRQILPIAPAAPNWTGGYVGLTFGAGNGESNHCDLGLAGNCSLPPTVSEQISTDPSGSVFGVVLGYNHQFSNNIVIGGELGFSLSQMEGSSPSGILFDCGTTCDTEIERFATLRLRLGYAFGNFLPYVTGGVAQTTFRGSIARSAGTVTDTGAVYGVGAEYLLSNDWILRAEVLQFEDVGIVHYDTLPVCPAPGCALVDNGYTVARLGVLYRF